MKRFLIVLTLVLLAGCSYEKTTVVDSPDGIVVELKGLPNKITAIPVKIRSHDYLFFVEDGPGERGFEAVHDPACTKCIFKQ